MVLICSQCQRWGMSTSHLSQVYRCHLGCTSGLWDSKHTKSHRWGSPKKPSAGLFGIVCWLESLHSHQWCLTFQPLFNNVLLPGAVDFELFYSMDAGLLASWKKNRQNFPGHQTFLPAHHSLGAQQESLWSCLETASVLVRRFFQVESHTHREDKISCPDLSFAQEFWSTFPKTKKWNLLP